MEVNRTNGTSFGMSLHVNPKALKKIASDQELTDQIISASKELKNCQVDTTVTLSPDNKTLLYWVERPTDMGGRFANPYKLDNGEFAGNVKYASSQEKIQDFPTDKTLSQDNLRNAVNLSMYYDRLINLKNAILDNGGSIIDK